MKKLLLFFTVICFGGVSQHQPILDARGIAQEGEGIYQVLIFSEEFGGDKLLEKSMQLRFRYGFIEGFEMPEGIEGDAWIEIRDGSRLVSDGRIRYTDDALRRETPDTPGETTEEMATHLQIGRVGETDDLVVNSPRTGFGVDTPSERIDVDGAVAIREGSSPTSTTDVGKVYVNDADGHLYFIDEAGNITDLTVDANAIQSISSSANHTGRTEHMRMIPGEGAEITESATDDTIYIHYSLGGTAPCSAAPASPASIEGPSTVCEMAEGIGYAVPPVAGATYYYWTLPAESYISTGAGSNSVMVNFGATDGNISVTSYNDCGTSTPPTTLAITMNHAPLMPGTITGTGSVCASATESYSISPVTGATSYSWTLPTGAFIASGYGTNSVTVTFASTSGTICVTADNACGSSDPQCMPVTVFSSLSGVMPGAITGPSSVCAGATGEAYSISEMTSATSYSWTVPSGASIVSGGGTNSIIVDFGTTSGNVSVTASNSCGTSDARTLAVAVSPNSVGGSISGTSSICLGSSTGTLTLSGNVGSVTKWQKSRDGGGWVDISRTDITYSETPSLAGTWEYRAEVRSGACDAVYSAAHSVTVAPSTVGGAVSGGTTPLCLGTATGTMTLSGHTGSIVRWQRQLDGGSWTDIGHTAASYSETPSSTGSWQYRAVVQSSPCSQENSVPVLIEVTPVSIGGAVTGGTTPICEGSSTGTMTLSGHTGDIVKWQRSNDGGSSWTDITHTTATYSETPTLPGTYEYRAVVQSGPCSQVFSLATTIVVEDATVGGTVSGGSSTICLGEPTGTLTLSGHTGSIVKWQRSTDSGSTWSDISHTSTTYSETPGSAGGYQYRAVVQNGVCSEVASIPSSIITVNPVPSSAFTISTDNPAVGFDVAFSAAESGATYSWIFPGGSPATSVAQSPTVTWSSTGTRTVSLSVTKGGCTSSRDTTITVRSATTASFSYTGSQQTWTVPSGVTSIQIECWGAQGGERSAGVSPGLGGYAKGYRSVSPGQSLYIYVGGQGTGVSNSVFGGAGWNGGGNAEGSGGGGGGGTDVRAGGTALTNRIIVAGGGGGTGYNAGDAGDGGGLTGGDGGNAADGSAAYGGDGGTQSAGGAGGSTGGTSGTLGQGGNGGDRTGIGYSGGGGGGYYGGGGGGGCVVYGTGYGASGGGGSSYLGGVTGGTTTPGVRSGNGQVIISY